MSLIRRVRTIAIAVLGILVMFGVQLAYQLVSHERGFAHDIRFSVSLNKNLLTLGALE